MKVELSRFRVKAGKSERVDEWIALLNSRIGECVQTLEREQMKLEVIFREIIDGQDYLYWFSIQDEKGEPVEHSPFEVDKKHMEFWDECIDEDYGDHRAQVQTVIIPDDVARTMGWANPTDSVAVFQRREIILKRVQ